jgi:hypothetical protein
MTLKRKIIAGAVVWIGVSIVVAIALVGHPETAAGQVAVCNPDAYGGINWRWVECTHQLHGHEQWRGGTGTGGHTIGRYRDEAAAFRRFLAAHR